MHQNEIEENHWFLKPFFGVPAHNNKLLQVLYPAFSLFAIAEALIILEHKKRLGPLLKIYEKFANMLYKMPDTAKIAIGGLQFSTGFAMLILVLTSFIRTVRNKENFSNKIDNTSRYSKLNDFCYWLGALGAGLAMVVLPFTFDIGATQNIDFNLKGAVFNSNEFLLLVAAGILALALTMSIISTFFPNLTRPRSVQEGMQVAGNLQKGGYASSVG